MQHLHLKHVAQVMKLKLPNINITMDQNSMNKLIFIYVYKKSSVENDYPNLFSHNSESILRICGEINLDNYPATSPQIIIYGDIPHCHVYKIDEVKYKVCHSLDRSFEWYFKNNQTATFNPSMTLVHYVISMYKFLAEDDKLHVISNDRSVKSFEYWKQYKFPHSFPLLELSYVEATEILNNILFGTDTEENKQIKCNDNHTLNTYYIDYVDKIPLHESFDDIILPIFHDVKRLKHYVDTKVLNFTKKKYYDSGIRKTSYGYIFTNYIPAVINSSRWNRKRFLHIFNEECLKMYSSRSTNMLISSLSKSNEECYIYTIFELINEIVQSMIVDNSIKDYKMKLLLCVYHIYLYVYQNIKETLDKVIKYIKLNNTYDENIVQNLSVIIGILMCSKTSVPSAIIQEMFYRMTYRSIHKIANAKHYLSLVDKTFIIDDINGWENLMWDNCCKFAQTIALLKTFFNTVESISLQTLDESIENIMMCKDDINKILSWDNLDGIKGFNAFSNFIGQSEINNNDMIAESFNKFNENNPNSNIINRWKYHGSYYSTYYNSITFPSDII